MERSCRAFRMQHRSSGATLVLLDNRQWRRAIEKPLNKWLLQAKAQRDVLRGNHYSPSLPSRIRLFLSVPSFHPTNQLQSEESHPQGALGAGPCVAFMSKNMRALLSAAAPWQTPLLIHGRSGRPDACSSILKAKGEKKEC